MKVPEKNPLETDKNNDINDVSLYRKKKKKAKRIRNLIILLVVILALRADFNDFFIGRTPYCLSRNTVYF